MTLIRCLCLRLEPLASGGGHPSCLHTVPRACAWRDRNLLTGFIKLPADLLAPLRSLLLMCSTPPACCLQPGGAGRWGVDPWPRS